MFETSPRRHPLQTTQFWFLLLFSGALLAAWQFELISFGRPESRVAKDEFLPTAPGPWEAEGSGEEMIPLSAAHHRDSSAPLPPNRRERQLPDWARAAPSGQGEAEQQQPEPAEPKRLALGDSGQHHGTPALEDPFAQGAAKPPADGVRTASAESTGNHQDVVSAQLENAESASPVSAVPAGDEIDLVKVDRLIQENEDVPAHRLLSTWYWQFPDRRPEFEDRLNLLARRIYFLPQPHYLDPYRVEFGDRLETIAKAYSVPWEYLSRLNRTPAERIRSGQMLKVIQGPFSAVVDLRKFELTVHAHGYYVTRFDVGIGQDGSTPTGAFQIVDKVVNPKYYGPDQTIEADDPANPLGERWLAISNADGSLQGYGIHGTIAPDSIGKAESQGCIRLTNEDVAELYDLLSVGSEVIIRQ